MIHSHAKVPAIISHPFIGFTSPTLFGPSGYMDPFLPYLTGTLGPIPVDSTHGQNPNRNSLTGLRTWIGLPRSCGHHMTIAQPHVTHATLSADHLAGGPGTWGLQPSFPSIFSVYGMLMLFWLLCSVRTHTCSWSQLGGWLYAPVPCFAPHLLHPMWTPAIVTKCLPDHILIAYCAWDPVVPSSISSSPISLYLLSSIIISLIPIEHCSEESKLLFYSLEWGLWHGTLFKHFIPHSLTNTSIETVCVCSWT